MKFETLSSFSDELTKIAFYQKLSGAFLNTLKEGWHGTVGNRQHWMGSGPNFRLRPDAAGNLKPLSRAGRVVENVTSLGGLTKALPVGSKSITALSTALMARSALNKQDPSGMERSRTERLTGLAGNTVGGLMGSAAAMKLAPRSPFLAPLVGGIVGGGVGEKMLSAPFAMIRNAKHRQQISNNPPPMAYNTSEAGGY